MIIGHGGNIFDAAAQIGCRPADIIDMSSNINPLGPMKTLVDHLSGCFDTITRLPDVDARRVVELFATVHRLKPGNVLAGNGSTEFIYSLPRALTPRKVLILGPTYADYADACSRHGLQVAHRLSEEGNAFLPDLPWLLRCAGDFDTVFICNPNNPTGVLIRGEEMAALCRRHPATRFVVDESYLAFVAGGRHHSLANHLPQNAVVLQSLSKIFRIPGLRVGFLIAAESLVDRFRPWMLPWNVNGLAQAAVEFLMQQHREVEQFVERSSEYVRSERSKLFKVLKSRTQAVPYPSDTVFFLVRLPDGKTASEVKDALLQHRLLIRDCSNFEGLSQRYIRVSVKTAEFNQLLAERLTAELNR
jgi:threonine-phosphate decarboxylase